MYVWGKNSIYRAQYYPWFQASIGGPGTYAPWIKGGWRTVDRMSDGEKCNGEK